MTAYMLRRAARALATAAVLTVAIALLATARSGCGPWPCLDGGASAAWLGHLAQLDLGPVAGGSVGDGGVANGSVATAIGSAVPASLLLIGCAALIALPLGWGGGLLLAIAGGRQALEGRRGCAAWPAYAGRTGRVLGQVLAGLAQVAQGVPSFWLGGLLVALFSVGLGWLPPGGIVGADLPAFGDSGYLAALAAHPTSVLGDLLAHLLLPALTLALAGLATPLRLISTVLPAQAHAPHGAVARAAGLSPRRLLWRATRPTLPVVIGGVAGDLPALASALILVEYLFGWPGLGLLAYHAARAGDAATLEALALLAGLAVIVAGFMADVLATWADPRLRGASHAP